MISQIKQKGFTIVELLIVIVVIGILAAISIVAYNNLQQNARDSARTQAISQIQKALELYKTEHGTYPARIATGTNAPSGYTGVFGTSYSYSFDTAGNWMKNLKDSGLVGDLPVDPINNNTYHFVYWSAPTGYGACTEPFYVLGVKYERTANIPSHSVMPLNCTGGGVSAFWAISDGAIFSNIKTPGS